jgi:OmpA-OmpF porin, OOP family
MKLLFIFLSVLAVTTYSEATSIDFKNVCFKPGLPKFGGNFDNSAFEADKYAIATLTANASTFLKMKTDLKVRIVGFTDDRECAGNACYALSLRRAVVVQTWLIAHGFPLARLLNPEGHGSNDPIDTNSTENGRLRNRRAEFQIVPNPDSTAH